MPHAVFLLELTLRFLLLLEVADPLFQDADGILEAGDGRVELEVEAEGDADLVMGLGDATGVVGEVLLVAAEARVEVVDGLRVVLALYKENGN